MNSLFLTCTTNCQRVSSPSGIFHGWRSSCVLFQPKSRSYLFHRQDFFFLLWKKMKEGLPTSSASTHPSKQLSFLPCESRYPSWGRGCLSSSFWYMSQSWIFYTYKHFILNTCESNYKTFTKIRRRKVFLYLSSCFKNKIKAKYFCAAKTLAAVAHSLKTPPYNAPQH